MLELKLVVTCRAMARATSIVSNSCSHSKFKHRRLEQKVTKETKMNRFVPLFVTFVFFC